MAPRHGMLRTIFAGPYEQAGAEASSSDCEMVTHTSIINLSHLKNGDRATACTAPITHR